jgi:hypothetical protein
MLAVKLFINLFVSAFVICCVASVGMAQQQTGIKVLTLAPQTEVRFAAPWQLSAIKYSNANELVVLRKPEPRVSGKQLEPLSEYPVARTLITTEVRSNHEDALKRLEDIAASRDAATDFIEVGGWPAIEVKFTEKLQRRGKNAAVEPEVQVERAITAIAQDNKVVIFDTSLLQEAPPDLMKGAQEISKNVRFAKPGNPNDVKNAITKMQAGEKERRNLLKQAPQSLAPETNSDNEELSSTGATSRVQNGVGELEITSSGDANNIVIASNAGLSFSTNRGASFTAGTSGVFGLNDPSLARGASGNFYLDVIAFPNGTPAHLNVTGCTNAASRSTNNGAAFTLQGYSARQCCTRRGSSLCGVA